MAEEYTKDTIWRLFRETRYCVLANQAGDGTTDVRTMAFSCNRDLRGFYMLSPKNARKIEELSKTPQATLHVYSIAKDMDEFVQFVVKGTVNIQQDARAPGSKEGLLMLGEKLGMLKEVQEKGLPDDCVLIELRAKDILVTRYLDILHDLPATMIAL